jgi:hypothetical protein
MALDLRERFLELLNDDNSIFLNDNFIYSNGYEYDDIDSLENNDVVYEIHNIMGNHGEFSLVIHKQDLDTLKLNEEGNLWNIDAFDEHGDEAEFSIQFVETNLISVDPS